MPLLSTFLYCEELDSSIGIVVLNVQGIVTLVPRPAFAGAFEGLFMRLFAICSHVNISGEGAFADSRLNAAQTVSKHFGVG